MESKNRSCSTWYGLALWACGISYFHRTFPSKSLMPSRIFAVPLVPVNHDPPLRIVRSMVRISSYNRLPRSEEHTSELQSRENLVCRLLLEKKKTHRRPYH